MAEELSDDPAAWGELRAASSALTTARHATDAAAERGDVFAVRDLVAAEDAARDRLRAAIDGIKARDPAFPLYSVVYYYDTGDGTAVETTSLMRPWLFEADPGADEVERQAREVWPTINFRGEPRERRLLRIEVERKPDTPWALGWFAHQTFRAGRSDDELRESFERFVRKHEDSQDYNGATPPPGYHCLMGAEDRWRWKPLCECERCVRDGVALIAH